MQHRLFDQSVHYPACLVFTSGDVSSSWEHRRKAGEFFTER